jgi:hypothetical protein
LLDECRRIGMPALLVWFHNHGKNVRFALYIVWIVARHITHNLAHRPEWSIASTVKKLTNEKDGSGTRDLYGES